MTEKYEEAFTPQQEEAVVMSVLRKVEGFLPYECRYKFYDTHQETRTADWITQESSTREGKEAAKIIAKQIQKAGVKGWTVRVVIRDDYDGDQTKWQGKAKS
jgi:hypothetical protein